MNAEMIEQIQEALHEIKKLGHCRLVILSGKGKNFCAGADLKWMAASRHLSALENKSESQRLADMFETLYQFPLPTLALVKGAVYGGGLGLMACCDFVVAHRQTQLCLSEVKLGLLPAVILPYLAKKMRYGDLKRMSMTARKFSAEEALRLGLIEIEADEASLEKLFFEELNLMLQAGPQASQRLKILLHELNETSNKQSQQTVDAICEQRAGAEAKSGVEAFFAKQKTPWFTQISKIKGLFDGQ